MTRMWTWWASRWARTESPRTMAVVRILVALVLLYDFWKVYDLGLVVPLWGVPEVGGLAPVMTRDPVPEMYRWLPATAATAWAGWGVMVVALLCLLVGFLTPLAGLVALLVSAQLAWILPLGDRGIDLMLRNVLLLLALSGCGRVWSVDAKLFGEKARIPSWPRYLLVIQLLVMYFAAGIQKTSVTWWPLGGYSALYLILQDPSIAAWKFQWLDRVYPLTQLAAAATMMFELGAGAVLLSWWYRDTRTRPGRLRSLYNRLDVRTVWLLVGVLLHIGIAGTMSLGIFPYAMLAMYPAFFHPDELPRWLRAARGVEARAAA
ncbi:MAG: HTTM domain-containing protein [Myxococcota bacterium]